MLPSALYPTLKVFRDNAYVKTNITDIYEAQSIQYGLGLSYVLTNDIDATITSTWNDGAGFVPIGTTAARFAGTFDGKGFTITGLYINRPAVSNQGLFGSISTTGVVKNVFVNGSIIGTSYTGLFGQNSGLIENCVFSGNTSSGSFRHGHLCGTNETTGIIRNCYTLGSLVNTRANNDSRAGGLVGFNIGTVTNCFSQTTMTVDANVAKTGILVGENTGTITYSYALQIDGLNLVGLQSGTITGSVLSSADFKDKTNFTDWDFNSDTNPKVWDMGYDFPIFADSNVDINAFSGQNNGTISNSYYNSDLDYQLSETGVTGFTSSQMTDENNFETWDFNDKWGYYNELYYPSFNFIVTEYLPISGLNINTVGSYLIRVW